MFRRKISGFDASVVAFGAWAVGGWMWGGAERSESILAIRAAIESGINLIDTAPVYGFGASEEIVGEAIKDFKREEVIIASKCGIIWHEERGEFICASDEKEKKAQSSTAGADKKLYRCLAPKMIRWEVEQSLQRLQIDYIDIYQTHWQEATTPIADTMGALLELKQEGKIRAIGCSNASVQEMQEYLRVGQLDVDQEKYNMLDREMEQKGKNLDFVEENGLAFLAYSPLAQGMLTGKIDAGRVFGAGDQRNHKPRFEVENRRRVAAMLEEFVPVADKHKISLGQLVIAWTFQQQGCSHVLIGARTPEQARENAFAGGVSLSAEDLRLMRAVIEKHAPGIV